MNLRARALFGRITWNPVKELKGSDDEHTEHRGGAQWNPVKELKVPRESAPVFSPVDCGIR